LEGDGIYGAVGRGEIEGERRDGMTKAFGPRKLSPPESLVEVDRYKRETMFH
jgi:hypothetical protein